MLNTQHSTLNTQHSTLNTQHSTHLFICLTPLHLLIAEKIIEQQKLYNVDLITLTCTDNDKYRYYYQRVTKLCQNSVYVNLGRAQTCKSKYKITELRKALKKLRKNYSLCYLANLKHKETHFITSHVGAKNYHTFDDGIANISHRKVDDFAGKKKNYLKKIRYYLRGIKHDAYTYLNNTSRHYTLFPHQKNILKNTYPIQLINSDKSIKQDLGNKVLKIFVGQPLHEIGVDESILKNIIQSNNIKFYFPHPREINIIQGLTYIHSNRILEDYILHEIQKDPSIRIELHSFFSTSLILLKELENVDMTAYSYNNVPKSFENIWNIFKENGIKVIHINENIYP
ncbi:glycosyltransferase family 52 [Lonepinella sp. BR2271]|uniref:glycosyltransferase family 52 n=1 Tax=Lonepinella sp. BR2271 TaxID=3434550 RepID=UPI003F6E246C